MKRLAAGLVVGVMIGGAVPVTAGAATSTVGPNPVRHGKRVTIKAFGCTSAPFESPFVETTIVNSDGDEVYSSSVPGDDTDAINTVKVRIRKKKYPAGTYTVHVDCFMDAELGSDTYRYQDVHELKVKKKR